VFIPLIYGEGEEYASLRLKEEVQKRQEGREMKTLLDLSGKFQFWQELNPLYK
jgi:hypothetical protein